MMLHAYKASMVVVAAAMVFAVVGCSSYRMATGSPEELAQREQEARETIQRFRETDPTMERFFDTAAGYAVFPRVTKGGMGIGAAHGRGVVYEDGELVGYASLTQGTIGAQLGGQSFSQIIFFEDEVTLNTFKRGNLEFAAQASAVAASRGAAANADFSDGVAVFSLTRTGLMFEASIGGQQFEYVPVN